MSFDDGMRAFKAGSFQVAAEQFAAVTEKDENNHKAWNALGICLSKVGEYESAGTCFDNAVSLDPANSTYKKNQAKNDKKRGPVSEDTLVLDDEPVRKAPLTPSVTATSGLWTLVKIGGGIVVFLIFCMVVAAFVFGMSGGSAHKQVPAPSLSNNVQAAQITTIATPTVEQTLDPVTAGEKNAAKKAKSYLEYSAFSRGGLIHQLEFEKFTPDEAEYGVSQTGADWNEQAAKKAKGYLDYSSFSRDGLIKQLEFEKFTPEQAAYGATAAGY